MNVSKRAAFALMIKRYTKAKRVTKETARESLIAEGIYTENGKLAVQYGGKAPKRNVSGKK